MTLLSDRAEQGSGLDLKLLKPVFVFIKLKYGQYPRVIFIKLGMTLNCTKYRIIIYVPTDFFSLPQKGDSF